MNALENKIIISTRPLSQNDTIKTNLLEKGAKVLDFPMIEICPVEISDVLKSTLQIVNTFDWIIFTSMNGVDHFYKLLRSLSIGAERYSTIKIAVIGKKTAEEVVKNNGKPFLISSGNTSEDLLHELSGTLKDNDRILLALGELADDKLEKGLSDKAEVTRINVYRTIEPKSVSKEIIEILKNDRYNIIIFTSPSGFINFRATMNKNQVLSDFRVACIGKTTEKELLKNNCKPLLVSSRSDGKSFVEELENYYIKTKI